MSYAAHLQDSRYKCTSCVACAVGLFAEQSRDTGMVINPIVGVCIPIIRIPIKGGMTIPNIATFDHGTYGIYDHICQCTTPHVPFQ